eukprot:30676-Pelagococcus_subviridis.AAC.1
MAGHGVVRGRVAGRASPRSRRRLGLEREGEVGQGDGDGRRVLTHERREHRARRHEGGERLADESQSRQAL